MTQRPKSPFDMPGGYTTPPYAGGSPTGGPQLPSPPPDVTGKKASIWDKEHISETLANIGQAFLSNGNFSEGLGAAAGAISSGMRGLRQERVKGVEYGGPDDMFEITTDPTTGERTIREVPEFAKAVQAKRDAQYGMRGKDAAALRSNALFGIGQMPPEEREAAYQALLQNGELYGIDAAGLPPQWDDSLGAIAGGVGMSSKDYYRQQAQNKTIADRKAASDERARLQRERLAKMPPPGAKKPQGYAAPKSRAEFDALASGTKYVAPDGSIRIKP
jgi:hypothetical protein